MAKNVSEKIANESNLLTVVVKVLTVIVIVEESFLAVINTVTTVNDR